MALARPGAIQRALRALGRFEPHVDTAIVATVIGLLALIGTHRLSQALAQLEATRATPHVTVTIQRVDDVAPHLAQASKASSRTSTSN